MFAIWQGKLGDYGYGFVEKDSAGNTVWVNLPEHVKKFETKEDAIRVLDTISIPSQLRPYVIEVSDIT